MPTTRQVMPIQYKEENNDCSPKYSLSHLTLLDCPTPELVYIASRAGFDAICPRLIPMGVAGECPFPLLEKEMMRATLHAMKTTGMEVQAIELARITDPCDIKSYVPALEGGAELGARQLIASAWNSDPEDHKHLADTFAALCDLAGTYGMSVSLEFPSFSSLSDLRQTADIVNAANRANGGILVDVLYMHMSKVPPEELETLPSEWFHHIHVCDALPEIPDNRSGKIEIARNSRLYPGEGCIDFEAIIECLPPVDYCIEIPNKGRIAELGYEEHARRCLKEAKKVLRTLRSKRIPEAAPRLGDKSFKE